jgi:hypothetical protein
VCVCVGTLVRASQFEPWVADIVLCAPFRIEETHSTSETDTTSMTNRSIWRTLSPECQNQDERSHTKQMSVDIGPQLGPSLSRFRIDHIILALRLGHTHPAKRLSITIGLMGRL